MSGKNLKQGLTIIEVVVSMAIVAVALVPMLTSLLHVGPEARVVQERYALELLRSKLLQSDDEFSSFSESFEHKDLRGVVRTGKIERQVADGYLCKSGEIYVASDSLKLEFCEWNR